MSITILSAGIVLLFFRKKNQTLKKAPSTNSLQQVNASLNTLFHEMGHEQGLIFLTLCIKSLTETSNKLNQHIHNKEWDKAKVVTHKLLGSSNLYASIELQNLLKNIDAELIANENLEQALLDVQIELTQELNYIKKWKTER